MKILVLGGTGYLGSCLIKRILKEGHMVICTKRKTSDLSCLKDQNIKLVDASESDVKDVLKTDAVELVINLTCSYENGIDSYVAVVHSNLYFPLHVLNLCVQYQVPHFITIGTGLPDEFNMYSFSKKELSEFGRFFSEKHNMNFVELKLEMFYGVDEPRDRFVSRFLYKMKKNERLELTIGTQKRDIIYIDDVIESIVFLIGKELKGYWKIPIGTGEGPTIRQVIEYMHNVTESKSELCFGAIPMRQNEPDSIADISILKELGFQIKYSWQAGIDKMIMEA